MVGLILGLRRRPRVALAWLGAVGGVLAVILALKVACYACVWLLPILGHDQADPRSPSGHTASAAVAYGGLATLQAGRVRDRAVKLALVSATVASVAVGLSRLALGAHSVSEVVLAGVVGTAGVLAFVSLAGQRIGGALGLPLLAGATCVVVLAHGHHLGPEALIQGRALPMLRSFITGYAPGPTAGPWAACPLGPILRLESAGSRSAPGDDDGPGRYDERSRLGVAVSDELQALGWHPAINQCAFDSVGAPGR